MKVSLIDPVGGKGGMEFYDYGLALGLAKNNVTVHYFTCINTEEINYENVFLHYSFGDIWKHGKIAKLIKLLKGNLKAFKFSKVNNINHVHFQFFHLGTQNIIVLLLAKCYCLKTIVTLHDVDSLRNNNNNRIFQKIAFLFINHFIVHNQFSFDELKKKNINESKIDIIPHGNYLTFIKPINYPIRKDNQFRLLFFGQIKEVKGLDILIRAVSIAIKQNKNIHLTIAGKPWGTSKDYYEKLIEELDIESAVNTEFGYIENDQVKNYFQNCDVVVLPYKKIYQSGVLLLSMSYGRVTLCSDLDAFKEIITNKENGYLFESESENSLSEQIIDIANNYKNLNNVRSNALKKLRKEFNWEVIGMQTKKIYEKK